ncbi:MAG: T9SS type A sorting domain-containing protein, partial [Bacteroidota bacterium]
VTVTNADGCEKVATYTVEEFKTFDTAIQGETQVCNGESSTITASGGVGYQWSNGATTASVNLAAGDYRVTITNGDGCEKVETVSITELPLFQIEIAGERSICAGETTPLTATAGQTYRWSNGATTRSIDVNAGEYSVTVTNADGCVAIENISVRENPLPEFSIASAAICSESRSDYQLDIITDANNQVNVSQGIVSNGENGLFQITAVPAGTDVVITIENEFGCTFTQTVIAPDCSCPALPAPNSNGDVEICAGEMIPSLSVSSMNETLRIDWYDAPTGGNLLSTNSNSFTPDMAGIYYAETVETDSGCKSSTRTAVALVINELPQLAIQSISDITCAQTTGTIILEAFGDHPPYEFAIAGAAFKPSAAFRELPEGDYTLLVRDAKGCVNEIMASITTQIRFDVQNTERYSCEPAEFGLDTTFLLNELGCDSLIITEVLDGRSDTVTLAENTCDRDQVASETLVFRNQFGCDSTVIINYTLLASDTTFLVTTTCDPNGVGERTLNLQNQAGCDSVVVINTSFSDKDVLFINMSSCDVTAVGIDTAFFVNQLGCDSLIITETILQGTPDTTFLQDITCDFTRVGLDTMFLTNQSGCDSLVITELFFAFPPAPSIATPPITTGCEGDPIILVSSPYTEGLQWLKDGEELLGATASVFAATTSGVYSVTYTDEEGCTVASTDMVTLDLTPLPALPVFTNDNNLLQLADENAFEAVTFQWFLDDLLIEGANESTYCARESGTYTLEVTDVATGCSNRFTAEVSHNPDIENCTVSIAEITPSYDASIYPNPYAEQFTIALNLDRAKTVNILLLDILGKVYHQEVWNASAGAATKTIRNENWANGVYLLSLQIEDKIEVFRMVKGN